MDSAIGLSTMLAIGPDNFAPCLDGFHEMDEHFRSAPFGRNLPVLMGLLAVWYNNFFGAQTVAVLPYEQYLKRFPAYLQQLTMESNGKHVSRDGVAVDYDTGPIYWGEPGNQRPAFLLSANPSGDPAHTLRIHRVRPIPEPLGQASRHAARQCLCTGGSAGLRQDRRAGRGGRHARWLVPHRLFDGNRSVEYPPVGRADAAALGKLIALYEHSVFTQGTIWQIDSFDQWGVELGKALAQRIIPSSRAQRSPSSSTTAPPTI